MATIFALLALLISTYQRLVSETYCGLILMGHVSWKTVYDGPHIQIFLFYIFVIKQFITISLVKFVYDSLYEFKIYKKNSLYIVKIIIYIFFKVFFFILILHFKKKHIFCYLYFFYLLLLFILYSQKPKRA